MIDNIDCLLHNTNMTFFAAEEESDLPEAPSPPPLVGGQGTMDDPYRPAAFDEQIRFVMEQACASGKPQYCTFENSLFRIKPDGNVEWSHNMPPLRDNIASIFEETLNRLREAAQA